MQKTFKSIMVLLLVVSALIGAGCGSQKSPQATVNTFFTAMKEGNYDKAKTCLAPATLAEIEEKKKFAEFAKELSWRKYLIKWDIVEEEAKNEKAVVKLKMKFKIGGFPEEWAVSLVKTDGKWKIAGIGSESRGDGGSGSTPSNQSGLEGNVNTPDSSQKTGEIKVNPSKESVSNAPAQQNQGSPGAGVDWLDDNAKPLIPLEAIQDFYAAVAEKDAEKARSLCSKLYAGGKGFKNIMSLGGPAKLEIVEQKIDGDKAYVYYRTTYKDFPTRLEGKLVKKEQHWQIADIGLWFGEEHGSQD